MKRLLDLQKRFAAGTATADDFSGVKGDDIVQLRKDAGTARLVVERGDHGKSKNSRAYPWTMSSEQPAGPWGDVVLFDSWNTAGYKERGNPLLWAHDGRQPWIGQTNNLKKVKASKTFEGSPTFLPEGMYEFADLIERMVDAGFMTNGSVGFNITDAYSPTDKERKARGMGQYGAVITAAELIEFSIVPVGADSKAVKRGYETVRTQLDSWVKDGSVDSALAEYACELLGIYEPLATRSIIVPDFSSKRIYGGGEAVRLYQDSVQNDAPAPAAGFDDFASDLLGVERSNDATAEAVIEEAAEEEEPVDDEPEVSDDAPGDAGDEEAVVELDTEAAELRALVEAQEVHIADLVERLDASTETASAHAQLAERMEARLQETEARLAAMVDTETRLQRIEGELVTLGEAAASPIFGDSSPNPELANFFAGLLG